MPNEPVTGDEIHAILTDALHATLPPDGENLLETGHVDSLTLVDLLLEIEERYGVEFSAEDLDPDHFESVDAIASLVNARRDGP